MTSPGGDTGSGGLALSRRSWLKVVGAAGLGLCAADPRRVAYGQTSSESEHRSETWRDYVERQLESAALPHQQVGIRIHFAIEGMSPADAQRLREDVKFGLLDEPVGNLKPLVFESTERVEVAVVRQETQSAPYRLRFDFPKHRSDVAIRVLHEHQTEVILHRDTRGCLHLRQYAPSANAKRQPLLAKKLGEVQRQIEDGLGAEARQTLDELERRRIDDPVALSLRAYLACLDGQTERLEQEAKRLVKDYPDLPDGHVALASIAQTKNNRQTVIKEYREALGLGLPVLLPFLESLWNGARLYDMDLGPNQPFGAQLSDAAENRIQNQLWSAWRPA